MLKLIALLLVVWLVVAVVGAIVEGLLWLLFIGIALFVGTSVLGWVKRNADT